jgi:hypothetical protein
VKKLAIILEMKAQVDCSWFNKLNRIALGGFLGIIKIRKIGKELLELCMCD